MRRRLQEAFELDDDPGRIDVDSVHAYFARVRWLLHTSDAHDLYAKFGFGPPGEQLLERK